MTAVACAAAAIFVVGGAQSRSLTTTTFTVDTTADTIDISNGDGLCADSTGHCSLRAAVQQAQVLGGPTLITVPAGTYTLSLDQLQMSNTITLQGAGANLTTIAQGSSGHRVIEVTSGTTAITGTTITGGTETMSSPDPNAGVGGGIYVAGGAILDLSGDEITGNTADSSGGGIDLNGTVAIDHSTIANNTVTGLHFGNGIGGGIDDFGAGLSISDSTIYGNSASNQGGGLLSASGTSLSSDTIVGNTAPTGAAVYVYGGAIIATVNTILGGSGGQCANGTLVSAGGNVSGDTTCGLTQPTDQQGVANELLGPFQNNGGATDTILPVALSPVLGAAVVASCPSDDQRGDARPAGGPCDSGAVQVSAGAPPPPTTFALTVAVSGSGTVSNGGSISCPGTCSASFASGTVVALTAMPASGQLFSGWSGACSGAGACSVTMNAVASVTATFTSAPSSGSPSGPPAVSPPSVSIAISPAATAESLSTLTATLAHSSATTVAYAWTFGDGTSRTGGAAIGHRYQNAGSYTVTVTVTDSSSGATIASGSALVVIAPKPPEVGLSVTPGQPVAGSAATLFLEIPTGQARQATVAWSFGDGSTASGTTHSTTHTYATAGTYTATVTETDTAGETLSASKSVVVAPQAIGPGDPNRSSVVADPPGAATQGAAPVITHSTVTVTLRDAWGRIVRNANVKVTADSATAKLGGGASTKTNSNGAAAFIFSDSQAETVHFTATDLTDGVAIAQTAVVTFGPAATKVAIAVNPASVPSDGTSHPVVTVTLTDGHGHPAASKAVRLEFTKTAGTAPTPAPMPATTDANGTATFTFISRKSATFRLSVSDDTDAKALHPSTPATVTFLAAPGGPASAATSTIAVDTQSVLADGTSKATITVKLSNAAGGAVPNTRVTLHTTSSLVQPSAKEATTDANGVATFTATATAAATATFTADDGADSLTVGPSPAVTFYLPVPDASTSSIVAAPTAEPADGKAASTVTVTLRDLGGKPVSGTLVALRATGSAVVVALNSISNGAGRATFQVADPANETVTVSAGVGIAGPPLISTTIRFNGAIAEIPRMSTVSADPGVVGDGASGVVTVRLTAGSTTSLADKSVWLEADSAHAQIHAAGNGLTDNTGSITFAVTDTTHETVTFTAIDASDGPLTIAQTASITFAPSASAAHSTLAASPASVPADNTTKASVTVTLRDVDGNPAVGRTLKLVLSPMTGKSSEHAHATGAVKTDADGTATFQVRDGTAETVAVGADDTDEGITVVAHPGLKLSFSAPTGGVPSASTTTIAASPTDVLAGSGRTSTVTVQLRNASGGAVAGRSVSLTASGGASTISPAAATTDSNGTATFTVADRTVENVTYTAHDAASGITSAAGATVDFYKHAVDAGRSTVTAGSHPVEADGATAATVVVTLLDPGGNPVSSKHVVLHASGDAVTSPASRTTDANGQAVFHVTDATGESVDVTAVDSSDRLPLSATTGIAFKAVPSSTASSVDVDLSNVSTNGDVPAEITVYLRDAHGHVLTNTQALLTSSSSHAQITQGQNSGGGFVNQFKVTDRQAETVTFTAIDRPDGIAVAQTVTVTFSAPATTAHAFIGVSPTSLPADGVSTANVTATFETAAGAPAAGKVVELVVNGIGRTETATTDANGEVTFTLKSLHARTERLAALDLSDTKAGHSAPPVETPTVTLTFS